MAHYKKHDLNFLAIGIEFEVANKPENRALLEEFGKELGCKLKADYVCWEVVTPPIPFGNKEYIHEILQGFASLNIDPCRECGTHIHFSYWGKVRYNATHVFDGAGEVYKFLLDKQDKLDTSKYGRDFNWQAKRFEPMENLHLPFKLSSLGRKHWVNFTEFTIEYRLPLFKTVNQFTQVIDDCAGIHKELLALLEKES